MLSKRFKTPVFLLVAGGVLIFIVAGFFWWTKVYENPYNVYWAMLSNNLSTAGVTKQVTQDDSGTHLDQTLVSTFGTQNAVHALTTLKSAKSTVRTETIGTLSQDSVRYTGVTTSQKSKSGQPFDFSNILNKWASNKVTNSSDANAATGLFEQTALGLLGGNLFPQASLSVADRTDLLKRLHNEVVFDTSYTDVQKSRQHGRPVYTYTVNIEPVAYVGFEKAFAQDLGLKALSNVDPNSYEGQSAIKVNVSVDVQSHQLIGVSYPGQNHQEAYSGYGVTVAVSQPKATISGSELQSLLSGIK